MGPVGKVRRPVCSMRAPSGCKPKLLTRSGMPVWEHSGVIGSSHNASGGNSKEVEPWAGACIAHTLDRKKKV